MNTPATAPQPNPTGLPAGSDAAVAGPGRGDAATPRCGWFESSWELQQGLAVSELPAADLAVAALWFPALEAGRAGSAWLQ